MEHNVPVRREHWSFFERQRQVFSDLKSPDDDFKEFDKELEQTRSNMFTLNAQDSSDVSSTLLKPERPIVSDFEGNKRLSLRFDCKSFKPEDITVKTVDNKLMVHAKHTEESPGRKVYREYSRQYVLPHKIDPLTLNSTFTADGVLSIEAPAPSAIEAPRDRILPILRL